ncbi:MAG: hypothetical protein QOK40_2104 [Miltoncostaeaceae bacterium]|nr:hypothetical protein [Miltoncostaeaceae bacterium]
MTAHRALAGLVALLAAAAPAAVGARPAPAARAPALTLAGWDAIGADFSGTSLVYGASAAVRLPRFGYQRTDVYRAPLTASGRLRGRPADVVVVRTSAGPMTAAGVVGAGGGRFVVIARGRGFAPPVVWCCDAADVQSVLESDGRSDAPVALAAAVDGARARILLAPGAGAGGGFRLVSTDPSVAPGFDRRDAPFPGRPAPGLAALAPGIAAWADGPALPGAPPSTTVQVGVPSDAGVDGVCALPQPGPTLAVMASAGVVVTAARAGAGVEVARYDLPTLRRRVVWRGARLPQLAVGGGAVALADGRRVLAGLRGLRLVRRAAGPVAAVAVSSRLVASFERVAAPARPGGAPRSTRVWLTGLA